MEFTQEVVEKAAGISPARSLWELLEEGASAADLEFVFRELTGETNEEALSILRMNLVGSLRSEGFIISGGRGGGSLYQHLGWEAPKESIPLEDWGNAELGLIDWVHSLPCVSDKPTSFELKIRNEQLRRKQILHENCFLYPIAYEGARRQIFWLQEGHNSALVIQKFKNRPVFYIFELLADPEWLIYYARALSLISCRPVKLVNVRQSALEELQKLNPEGFVESREQAIYDTHHISVCPEGYLNKRALTTLRARERDTQFCASFLTMPFEKHRQVITLWKELNQHKHRQLAITRDYIALDTPSSGKILFGGIREGQPVAHHLFDRLSNVPHIVALMNDKALNYSSVPGGKYGLSEWNLVMACRKLWEMGVTEINSGGIDGGGHGLPYKKMKFAYTKVTSYGFRTTFPLSRFA